MSRFTRFALVFLCLALLVAVPPLLAQDAAEPPPPVDAVTLPTWVVVALPLLFTALASGTVIAVSIIQNRSLKTALERVDKSQQDAIEAAYETLPESARDVISSIIDTGQKLTDEAVAALRFLRTITDGEPNTEPPDRSFPPPEAHG